LVGKTLAHYEILAPLGKGGMGEVYRARDTKLERDVAIKILPEDFAADQERLSRFEREAKSVAAIDHPNIVTVHSVEEADGLHFITLQLVEGQTLSELLPRNGFALEKLFQFAIPLVDAVSAAHERGIVHRDLKPSNIMVSDDGRLRVLDFGLAKLMEEQPQADAATEVVTAHAADLTEEGKVLGTVSYMSPEQAEGKQVDRRSDVFSLGIILYEMAVGERPFKGDTKISLISSIVKDQPVPATDLKRALPRHLGRILGHCLEKNPERRYQSAKDLRNDLEGLKVEVDSGEELPRAGEPIGPAGPPPTKPSALRPVWVVTAVLVAVISAIGYVMMQRDRAETVVPTVLRIATADSTTGVYFPVGTGIAEVVERGLGNVNVQVLSTDGSFENAGLLDRGDVDLAIAQNDVIFNSVNTDVVLGRQSTNITGLAVLYEEVAHIVVHRDAGIETIGDLRGKTVNLGLPDSGSKFTSEILLTHFGIRLDDLTPSLLPAGDANISLLGGGLQAAMQWSAAPYPPLQQLFRSGEVRLVSIDPEVALGLQANQPFLVPATIRAATYANQPDAASTVAVKALLVGAASLDTDLVYRLLEAIFANIPDLIAHHPRAADISPTTAFGLDNGMPIDLYPGAERFWRDLASR
jgi:TRAP transporter TAXI family solute receptor